MTCRNVKLEEIKPGRAVSSRWCHLQVRIRRLQKRRTSSGLIAWRRLYINHLHDRKLQRWRQLNDVCRRHSRARTASNIYTSPTCLASRRRLSRRQTSICAAGTSAAGPTQFRRACFIITGTSNWVFNRVSPQTYFGCLIVIILQACI